MPRSGMPVLAILGATVILAAAVAAVFVALLPVNAPYGDQDVSCGSALNPVEHEASAGPCPSLIRTGQLVAGGLAAVGAVVGIGLIAAGYQWRRAKSAS
jgi:hypothetical protein